MSLSFDVFIIWTPKKVHESLLLYVFFNFECLDLDSFALLLSFWSNQNRQKSNIWCNTRKINFWKIQKNQKMALGTYRHRYRYFDAPAAANGTLQYYVGCILNGIKFGIALGADEGCWWPLLFGGFVCIEGVTPLVFAVDAVLKDESFSVGKSSSGVGIGKGKSPAYKAFMTMFLPRRFTIHLIVLTLALMTVMPIQM